jgi:hypothetical protein
MFAILLLPSLTLIKPSAHLASLLLESKELGLLLMIALTPLLESKLLTSLIPLTQLWTFPPTEPSNVLLIPLILLPLDSLLLLILAMLLLLHPTLILLLTPTALLEDKSPELGLFLMTAETLEAEFKLSLTSILLLHLLLLIQSAFSLQMDSITALMLPLQTLSTSLMLALLFLLPTTMIARIKLLLPLDADLKEINSALRPTLITFLILSTPSLTPPLMLAETLTFNQSL